MRTISFFLLTIALASSTAPATEIPEYRETAGRLIGAALADEKGWEKLAYLCDRIGHRLSGSPQLEEAVRWAADQMRQDGLTDVRLEPVEIINWQRGSESLEMVLPRRQPIPVLGLGMSVGTPPEGIEADVVVVSSFDELDALGRESIDGRIVLYDVPWEGYGRTVRYRSGGASRAAAHGAVAVLVRSAGPVSLQTPHTGAMRYDNDLPRIPAAALSIESSQWLGRLIRGGESVRLHLKMGARFAGTAQSANVIGEIRGRENPEEVVVMGGHLDSWDVGQGAHDDGAGVIATLQAAALIQQLGLRPRRTIRVVFWTNEENGLAGARTYRENLGDQVGSHVAAIEMDGGSERPIGFGVGITADEETTKRAFARVDAIGQLLEGIGAQQMLRGGGGADIGPLMRDGVPGFGLRTVGEHYFDWHHTEADTLDKVDPIHFRQNVAALAVLAFVLADMPDRLLD